MDTSFFWKKLCDGLNFRFFVGMPNEDLAFLFNSMDKELLHYIPTVSDTVAVGLAGGVRLSGYKSVVINNAFTFDSAKSQITNFILANSIPILFITNSEYNPFGFKLFEYSSKETTSLEEVDLYMGESNKPALLLLKD